MRTRKRRPPAIIEYLFKPSPKLKAATERAIVAVMGEKRAVKLRGEVEAEFRSAQRKRA